MRTVTLEATAADDIDDLRAELARLRTQVAAMQAELAALTAGDGVVGSGERRSRPLPVWDELHAEIADLKAVLLSSQLDRASFILQVNRRLAAIEAELAASAESER